MNKQKILWILPMVFTGLTALGLLSTGENVKAVDIFGCAPSATRLAEVDTSAEFQAYLAEIGVAPKKYISRAGKELSVNQNYALNKCLIVYGTPSDVVTEARKVQSTQGGQPKFFGYNEKGQLYPNPEFPDVGGAPNYVADRDFIYQPWNNTALKNAISISPTKPFTNAPSNPTFYDKTKGRNWTQAEELDQAIDRFYLMNCASSCSKGTRGYFPDTNTSLGITLVGSNLKNYASVSDWPGKYSAGAFNLYYRSSSSGVYWSSTFVIKPHRLVLQEKRDLSIVVNSISPSSVLEGSNYTVNYTVCNKGEVTVTNPVIHYGESSATKSKTISTVLDETDCYTGNLSNTAGSVSADTTKTYFMEVNKSGNNPKDENDPVPTNNKSQKNFTVLNKEINGNITITSWVPTYPHSNQNVTINYKVMNLGNVPVSNVKYTIGYKDGQELSKTISSMNPGETKVFSDTVITPKIKDYSGTRTLRGVLTAGFTGDIDTSDNTDHKIVTIRNPDAFTDILVDNDSSNNTIGDVKVKVENRTWNNIKEDCSSTTAGCKTSTTATKYSIYIYDTKFTTSTSDDVLVSSYTPSYNLNNAEKDYFNIGRSVFTSWVQSKYPNTYQLVQFRIDTQIPEYGLEVDWDGNPSYANNKDTEIVNYFPPRPSIAATQCNEVNHSISTYFNDTSGFNPIKICAGHYPTYPSTTIESGMQAYHYVLYRFFPQPIPKYTVITPESNSSNPNHFSQIFQLPTTENFNQMGDFESMFFPNRISNGYYQERGRYMPTGGTFNFEVYKKNNNGSKGQQIALGTVSYNIPSTCYDRYKLDINHQYACDEILFFLPNPDVVSKKHEKPASYTSSTVTYPITGTKIPYLNPGTYTFEFKANENFRYYYQTNLINTGYKWNNPVFR